jgi:SAM-dependent methyltransferase
MKKAVELKDDSRAPYTAAVQTGQYIRKTGLAGKYDNVRRFWEDDVSRLFIRPFLKEMVDRKAQMLERLRILDIGCGSGDGYDLLMGITAKDVGIYEYAVDLINQEQLGFYRGIDINPDLIEQAREQFSLNDKVVFDCGDCLDSSYTKNKPYDFYFTSYGTVSHFTAEEIAALLSDIAGHSDNGALLIIDWLGRYSYEWQDLWSKDGNEQFMDYRISYIYPPEERDNVEIQTFPLKLVDRVEAVSIVNEASRLSGVEIVERKFFDRSIFVGRHIDTAEYNRNCTPVRVAVNCLLEPNLRTDLSNLIVDYVPRNGFPELNRFFDKFSTSWNTLVNHTIELLANFNEEADSRSSFADIYHFYPEPLKKAVQTMEKVIKSTGDLPGDSRANIIEPQLAYALRKLEMELQSGDGVGHGFVGIFEIKKQERT